MAFANVAGRAGFVLDLDKSALDTGLPEAERQFTQSVGRMQSSAEQMTASGLYSPQQVDLAKKYGLTDLINQNDKLDESLGRTNAQIASLEAGSTKAGAGMAGMMVRATGVGIAATAAFQGLQALAGVLDVTGAKSFTAEGKVRNLGAAILHLDPAEAVSALTRTPKTLEDLGLSADEAAANLDKLKIASDAFGGSATDIYEEAKKATDQLKLMAVSTLALGDAQRALAQNPFAFGPERGGTGGVAAGQQNLNPAFQAGTGGTTVGNTIRGSIASRIRDEGDRLQAELDAAQLEEQQARVRFENLRGQPGAGEAYKRVVEATTAVRRKQNEVADAADREREAAENEREAEERERERRLAEAARAREAAARARAAALRDRLSTRERNLRNAYEAALQTTGTRDDARTFGVLRRFFQVEGRDPRLTAEERAGYRGELVTLRGQRQDDIDSAQEAADKAMRDRQSTVEQRLQNRVAAAELTKKNVNDDLKALRGLRDFYKRAARDKQDIYTAAEQAQFEYERIGTQKKINEILDPKKDAKDASGFDAGAFGRSMLAAQQQIWTGMMSQFLGGTGAGNALQTHALEQFTLQGNQERAEQTRHLRAISARSASGGRILDEAAFG